MGALSSLIFNEFGVKTRAIENPVTNSVGVTFVEVLRNNPDRLGFVIINLSANDVYLSIEKDVSATKGVYLAPNGGSVSLVFREDFELVGYAWFAIATGAGSSIYVLEVEAE